MSKPLLLLLIICICLPGFASVDKGLNVFLISVDTLSAEKMSLYGYPKKTTPFIDKFAQQAVVFERAFAPATYTMASHMSLFTGMAPLRHQVLYQKNTPPLSSQIKTFPDYLSEMNFKSHLLYTFDNAHLKPELGFGRSVSTFISDDFFDYRRKKLENALGSLLQKGRGLNNFYFLQTNVVHSPYNPNPLHDRTFRFNRSVEKINLFRKQTKTIQFNYDKKMEIWNSLFNSAKAEDAKELQALYEGAIRSFDDAFEKFISVLKDSGQFKNSVIILTSDHGESFGEHGDFYHTTPYKNQIHIPLLIWAPGLKPVRLTQRVHLTDVLPTVLDYLQYKGPLPLDGKSLLPLVKDPGKKSPHTQSFVLGYFSEALFDDQWKYLDKNNQVELYNVQEDPDEKNDLAAKNQDVLALYKEKFELEKLKFTGLSRVVPVANDPIKKLLWIFLEDMAIDKTAKDPFAWVRREPRPSFLRLMSEGSFGLGAVQNNFSQVSELLKNKSTSLVLKDEAPKIARERIETAFKKNSSPALIVRLHQNHLNPVDPKKLDRLLNPLLQNKDNDTLVVVGSDCAPNMCTATPVMIWGPGVKKGHRVHSDISTPDVVATVYKLMNWSHPEGFSGQPLKEILE